MLALTVTTDKAVDAKREKGTDASAGIEAQMLAGADDPPRMQIERDEGRHYLYFGAKQDEGDSIVRVVARSDLEALVAPFLDASQEFAAVLLTTEKGEVLVQTVTSGTDARSA